MAPDALPSAFLIFNLHDSKAPFSCSKSEFEDIGLLLLLASFENLLSLTNIAEPFLTISQDDLSLFH